MNTQNTDRPVKSQRRWYIDWLRVLATLLLFYFHPAEIFNHSRPWYIQNAQKSMALTNLSRFIEIWHMPLFFLLAGVASWFALRRRSGGEYVKERFKRLLIPCVFGILVIVPPQIYFRLMTGGYSDSYIQFYPKFFDPAYTGGGFDMGQLWFIFFLFFFSLLALPLFLYLQRESGQRLMGKLAGFLALPGAIFLLALPTAVAEYVMLDSYPNPLYFVIFFLCGYILMADPRLEDVIDKNKGIALILGGALYAVWVVLSARNALPVWLWVLLKNLISWFCLITMLGYGKKFLNFANGFLKYFGAASYPLYILHQTVIVIIGFYVVRWGAGPLVKLVAISLTSFIATVVIYDLLVKRTNVTRFLFGMRPLRKKLAETPTPRRGETAA
jgi:peptidoglycan/LPS O-acetylase OafA/YrhL